MSNYVLVYGRSAFLTLFRKRYTDPHSPKLDLKLYEHVDVRYAKSYNDFSILFFSFIILDTGVICSIDEIDYMLEHFSEAEIFLIGESESPEITLKLKNKKYRRLCRHVAFRRVVPQIIFHSSGEPQYGI